MCIYAGNALIFGLTTCHDSAFAGLVMLFVHLRKEKVVILKISDTFFERSVSFLIIHRFQL